MKRSWRNPKPPVPPSTAGLAAGVVVVLSVPAIWYYIGCFVLEATPSLSVALWSCIVWGVILCIVPMRPDHD